MATETWYFTRNEDLTSLLAQAYSQDFWLNLNPELSITSDPFSGVLDRYALNQEDLDKALIQVREEGYLQTTPVIPAAECLAMAQAVRRIVDAGFHPLFLCLYDEYWRILKRVAGALEPILGPDCYPPGDFWVWCVSAQTAGAGWTPHRDIQFRTKATVREDNLPLIMTAWLPFTDTNPLNGCMYVLPSDRDPNLPDDRDNYAFTNHQDVRALPAQAGSILGWNQHLLHWGSRSSKWAKSPRISTGIYFQSADVDPFVPRPINLQKELPFSRRLAFMSVNILAYHRLHHYPDSVVEMCIRSVLAEPGYLDFLPADLKAALGG